MVKCLAEGHKHHGRGRGRGPNPHSDDSVIRTQIQCTEPLGHGTPLHLYKPSLCQTLLTKNCLKSYSFLQRFAVAKASIEPTSSFVVVVKLLLHIGHKSSQEKPSTNDHILIVLLITRMICVQKDWSPITMIIVFGVQNGHGII